jgi:hypothetical protein
MKPKRLSKTEIQNGIRGAIKDAVSFIESEIAPDRIRAQKYFDGRSTLSHEEGRSKVVATKCRDTIRAIKPALMRVFLQSDTPVEFIPRTPNAVQGAQQATKYARYIFQRNKGFQVLSDVIHDALIKKVGIAKVYYDETPTVEIDEYSGLTEDQIALILSDDEIEVLEQEVVVEAVIDETGFMVSPAEIELKVARTKTDGDIKIDSIAPEDFFVDRSATSIDDCFVCGHSADGRVGDLVALGFDFEEVFDLAGPRDGTVSEEEELARDGWDDTDDDENINDPSMRPVLITEAYMKMDIEGTGVPRLYKFLCAGNDYEVLDFELADFQPFAVFEVDPEPHTFFGRSLVEIIENDQDAATSMMRGLLDAIAMANNPRIEALDGQVNMDDLLNNEIGGIVRVKATGAAREMTIGMSTPAAVLPAMQFFDEAIRAKTGVSGAAMGLDADALQSQTAAGVNAAVQAATAVSELIARTLAEGGMTQLFKIVAQIARQHPKENEMMRIDGQFVPVDPRSWVTGMDLVTNVGLGNNKAEERFAALQQTIQFQMQAWTQFGPSNGLVTMTGIRNTLADMLELSGVHNADRYYNQMNPQIEQQLLQQAAQAAAQQSQGSDPNAAFLQAEQMKAQTRAQVDMQKAAMEHQRKLMEMAQSDDLARDEMAQKLLTDAAEILGKYGAQVDVSGIRQQQAAPREMQFSTIPGGGQ